MIGELVRTLREGGHTLVVGKAAAALMLLGGVSEMHTEVISRPALDLLAGSGMRVGYEVEVPHVINRDRTGWCPLEIRCRDCRTARECLERIEEFLQQQQIGTTNESK